MNIAICDNEQQDQKDLLSALHQYDASLNPRVFSKGAEFLSSCDETDYDLVFLDIFLTKESGMDLAKTLRQKNPSVSIVFTTTSREFAMDAFGVGAIHYLVKPVDLEEIREVFSRFSRIRKKERRILQISVRGEKIALFLDEIAFLTSANHITYICPITGEPIATYESLSALSESLDETFLLLARGMIVNMAYIESMQGESARLRNGQEVLLSRRRRAEIHRAFRDYIFQTARSDV